MPGQDGCDGLFYFSSQSGAEIVWTAADRQKDVHTPANFERGRSLTGGHRGKLAFMVLWDA